MANRLPSIIKPTDVPKLEGPAPKTESGKAEAYRQLRPGVDIPTEQAAERFERMRSRVGRDFGDQAKGPRMRARGRSIVIPELPWLKDKSA